MNSGLIAFVDESRKPVRDRRTGRSDHTHAFYVLAGIVVLSDDIPSTRDDLRRAVAELGHPLHYYDIGRNQQRLRDAARRVAAIDSWDGYLFETPRERVTPNTPDERLRSRTLRAAISHLAGPAGATDLALETRAIPGQPSSRHDDADHRVLKRSRDRGLIPTSVSMRHATKSEPLLWIADIIAGARTDLLCGKHSEPYALLTHRIRRIRQVDS